RRRQIGAKRRARADRVLDDDGARRVVVVADRVDAFAALLAVLHPDAAHDPNPRDVLLLLIAGARVHLNAEIHGVREQASLVRLEPLTASLTAHTPPFHHPHPSAPPPS